MTSSTAHLMDFLSCQLAHVEAGWSMGTFGAIAEFSRELSEPAELRRADDRISIVTERGGFCLMPHSDLRLIASESPAAESWSHRVALCLPEESCAMRRHTALTEVGPDRDALRAEDREDILFDLGLGTLQIDACIRVSEPEIVAALRSRAGEPLFVPGNDAMRIVLAANPHRVFLSRIGRAEVYQPIPPIGGKSPDGPHTHVLPKLLAHGRTHAATEPLPEGWVPCAHLYPPHPLRDQYGRRHAFKKEYHAAVQGLLGRYGLPKLTMIKRQVTEAVLAGRGPGTVSLPRERFTHATVRVALRQLSVTESLSSTLIEWLWAYDRLGFADDKNPMEELH